MKKIVSYSKPIVGLVLIFALILTLAPSSASAAKRVKLNKTKVTLKVGKTITLKLKNNKKRVKWASSNKKVATVSKKGKVKAVKKGKATITAKVGKKKYKCKVIVGKETQATFSTISTPLPSIVPSKVTPTVTPTVTSTVTPTVTPGVIPTVTPTANPSGKLNVTNQNIDLTQTYQLVLSGATAKSWRSSDDLTATVVDGLVVPLKVGTVTITCEDTDGYKYTCKIEIGYPDIKLEPQNIYTFTLNGTAYYYLDFIITNNCDYDILFGGKEPFTESAITGVMFYQNGYSNGSTAAFGLSATSQINDFLNMNPTILCQKGKVSTIYAFEGKTRYIPILSSNFMWTITINEIKYSVVTDYYGEIVAMISWGASDI